MHPKTGKLAELSLYVIMSRHSWRECPVMSHSWRGVR
jgi:hypothetical protein